MHGEYSAYLIPGTMMVMTFETSALATECRSNPTMQPTPAEIRMIKKSPLALQNGENRAQLSNRSGIRTGAIKVQRYMA
jgi:hypothetical protein